MRKRTRGKAYGLLPAMRQISAESKSARCQEETETGEIKKEGLLTMNLPYSITQKDLFEILLNIAPSRPVFIWGAPGIGKSALVENLVFRTYSAACKASQLCKTLQAARRDAGYPKSRLCNARTERTCQNLWCGDRHFRLNEREADRHGAWQYRKLCRKQRRSFCKDCLL